MKFNKKTFFRLLSFILTFVIMCFSAISVSAASTEPCSHSAEGSLIADEYVIPTETNLTAAYANTSYGAGRWYLGNFSFAGNNTGLNRTINGNRMRVCIAYKPVDGLGEDADISFYLNRYDGTTVQYRNICFLQDEPDSDGYRYYVLPWVNISYGVNYYFYYHAYTCCMSQERTVNCHVWIDVE